MEHSKRKHLLKKKNDLKHGNIRRAINDAEQGHIPRYNLTQIKNK